MSESEKEKEQLSRREVIRLTVQRVAYGTLAGFTAAVAVKKLRIGQRLVAADILRGTNATTNNVLTCDCTASSPACACSVPPPPK